MASWTLPRTRPRPSRDASPASPLSPLSPSTLPQWLRAKRPRSGVLFSSRVKTIGVVLACILLGWMMTASLGPNDADTLDLDDGPYDVASGGVMREPSGFGEPIEGRRKGREGILGSGDEQEMLYAGEEGGKAVGDEPSVSSALSELHHAVSGKLQSWNPYRGKPAPPSSTGAVKVGGGEGRKRPGNSTSGVLSGEDIKDGITEEERLGARTRIGKCTILFNGNSYWERAIRTHEQHDRIHGYRLHVLRQNLLDDVWSKPAYILSLLLRELARPESERLEWLFWVDADTIILNPYIPVETLLPPPGGEFDDVNLMYSNDWNGLNNGVFPVRVSVWSVQLFSAIVSFRHYRPDTPLTFRDQSAMDDLMKEPAFVKNIVQTPQRWFNAYQGEHNETLQPFQIRRGDLLVHFAGVPNREERMGYWLDRAEQHLDDWEIPVKSTSYPQEARDFWSEVRDHRRDQRMQLTETRLKATQLLEATEKRLNDYGDRLSPDQSAVVTQQREQLQRLLGDARWEDHVTQVDDAMATLTAATLPLVSAMTDAHKLLLNAAHEAIFAGEKDLLEHRFDAHGSDPDLLKISDALKHLKNIVLSPEEFWNQRDITSATDAVTEARVQLQVKTVAAPAVAKPAPPDVLALEKALAEARKQAAVDAEVPAAPTVTVVPQGATAVVNVVTAAPVLVVTGHIVTVTPEAVMVWTTQVVHDGVPTPAANSD